MRRTFAFVTCITIGLLAAAGACAREKSAPASSAKTLSPLDLSDPVDSATGVVASCEFVKTDANADPRKLIDEFVRRNADGEFLQDDPWFNNATDCPGHMLGWDEYAVIASYAISNVMVGQAGGTAVVTFKRLGTIGQRPDSTRPGTSIPAMRLDTATMADTVAFRRTPFGWRIAGRTPAPRVQYKSAFARGDLRPADTLRIAALLTEWK